MSESLGRDSREVKAVVLTIIRPSLVTGGTFITNQQSVGLVGSFPSTFKLIKGFKSLFGFSPAIKKHIRVSKLLLPAALGAGVFCSQMGAHLPAS